ncbi:hypothetical protein GL381_20395 [Salmonella enterica]|uniref:Uncharacterized protein n=1 Tax=Salmonella enterica TaxID=28901 RepID=A0A5Y2ZXX4_SALER|nr:MULTISPECIES: hypothetical protein [Enterobacteriaceae]EAO6817268.1 hypothetical protein [Salmonella enterica]AUO67259.1 hypothetical protein WM46_22495 [Citrobacter freundii complex sp. CFNIH2]EAS0935798.1 hypothetical protein [Salmonella enterica]EAT9250846.1 hypothetical protein [Salmonella enterica]EAV7952733.1 hypothetical protein [Salmonella enterica]
MSSIILLFITHTTFVLSRISEAMRQQQAEWFTNRSGHSSFRAEVVQSEGGFTAIISRRTGYSSRDWQYQQLASAGQFASARKALRAGRLMAQQMAWLRYRFD